MTTVAQMIEWLKTLPQDAEVECGKEVVCGDDTYIEYSPVDIDFCDILDYSSFCDVLAHSSPEGQARYPSTAGRIIIKLNAE